MSAPRRDHPETGQPKLSPAAGTEGAPSAIKRRRSSIRAWGALAGAAALFGLASSAGAAGSAAGFWTFASAPTLKPPSITVSVHAHAGPSGEAVKEYLFLAPIENFARKEALVGKPGPEILELDGNPVWQDPLGASVRVGAKHYEEVAMDFHTASYEDQPVLIWWHGYITPTGDGDGTWEIANDHYQPLASVRAPKGFETDFHDFAITPSGMAYFIGDQTVQRNLTCCGGPAHGRLFDQVVFEADVKTGRIVCKWDPLAHIALSDSYLGFSSKELWDPYRLNSVALDPDGDLIISARNTWAVYWIPREGPHSGEVAATLGGKHSSFSLGKNVHFTWQHDVGYLPGGELSVFADEAYPPEAKQSRGLVISLDWRTHKAMLVHQFLLPHPALSDSQGSVQMLKGGNFFVGWGELPYLSEYDAADKLVYLGAFHPPDESYRSYRDAWIGHPLSKPSIAVTAGGGGASANVHVSWNGATEVVSWQLLDGASPTTLSDDQAPVPVQGFETTIPTQSPGPYYAVEAVGADHQVLATSQAQRGP